MTITKLWQKLENSITSDHNSNVTDEKSQDSGGWSKFYFLFQNEIPPYFLEKIIHRSVNP